MMEKLKIQLECTNEQVNWLDEKLSFMTNKEKIQQIQLLQDVFLHVFNSGQTFFVGSNSFVLPIRDPTFIVEVSSDVVKDAAQYIVEGLAVAKFDLEAAIAREIEGGGVGSSESP
jgi:hypothetical protein